jgi:20S proteasome alpha/beta subunit
MTIDTNFQRVFKVTDHCLMGVAGLGTDVQTLYLIIIVLSE